MEAALGMVTAGWMRAFSLEGILDYPGALTRETLAQVGAHYRESFEAAANAANCAPDAVMNTVAWCNFSVWAIYCNRQHALPGYDFDEICGEGGARDGRLQLVAWEVDALEHGQLSDLAPHETLPLFAQAEQRLAIAVDGRTR